MHVATNMSAERMSALGSFFVSSSRTFQIHLETDGQLILTISGAGKVTFVVNGDLQTAKVSGNSVTVKANATGSGGAGTITVQSDEDDVVFDITIGTNQPVY